MSLRPAMFAAMAAALVYAPSAALAAHGKAGLWSSTTTVAIPNMPPQTHAATYCMTPAQVASNDPVQERNPNCAYQNAHAQGNTYSADLVCHGPFEATGHLSSTYDSDTHYAATITVTTNGMTMTNKVDGKWVKADCAGADH